MLLMWYDALLLFIYNILRELKYIDDNFHAENCHLGICKRKLQCQMQTTVADQTLWS